MIAEILKAILYGIVEGVTEWLPVSSTGHLILLKALVPLNVSDGFWNLFEVVIQLGAILAVILLFWGKLWPFGGGKSVTQKRYTWQLWFHVAVGVLPTVVFGLTLTVIGLVFNSGLMRLLGATPTILPYARDYAKYIFAGTVLMCSSFVLNNILRAEGKAVLSMVGLGFGGLLNIGLDPSSSRSPSASPGPRWPR